MTTAKKKKEGEQLPEEFDDVAAAISWAACFRVTGADSSKLL
jgi:hypothetical protein